MKFSNKGFFSKCGKLRIWSRLLKKSLMENMIFCAVLILLNQDFDVNFDKIIKTNELGLYHVLWEWFH